jgi:hypothetical protein
MFLHRHCLRFIRIKPPCPHAFVWSTVTKPRPRIWPRALRPTTLPTGPVSPQNLAKHQETLRLEDGLCFTKRGGVTEDRQTANIKGRGAMPSADFLFLGSQSAQVRRIYSQD